MVSLDIRLPESGRYRFRSVIGRGGGGVVLKVWDAKLQRPLAMKVVLGRGELRPSGDTPPVDAAVLTRFVDEARIASQLDHPGIVPVHELGTDASGRAFFTMRLVRGEDLGKIFERARSGDPQWSQARLIEVLVRVCEAVGYAHGKGVLHRDLKPANVMLGRHGEVHVMDWGLARTATMRPDAHRSGVQSVRAEERERTPDSPLLTGFGAAVGTPAYMAPEQARGELGQVDARSDVYAIGAMLYELLACEPPFVPKGAVLAPGLVLMRVVEGPPRPLSETATSTPGELVAICERAMAREPEHRYADVGALERDLRAFLEGRVVAAHESGTWAETRKWMRRNQALAAALAALLLTLIVGMATLQALAMKERRLRDAARWDQYASAILSAQIAKDASELSAARTVLDSAPTEHRGWEHAFLSAELERSSKQMNGVVGHVYALWCSPDGTRLVSDSLDEIHGRVVFYLWNLDTGDRLVELDNYVPRNIQLSHDGSYVLTIGQDDAKLWDGHAGTHLHTLGLPDKRTVRARFSKDGTRVVTAAGRTAYVWDTASGDQISRLEGHEKDVLEAEFSPDARQVVTGSADGSVRVWDILPGTERFRLEGHSDAVSSILFSPDGASILTGSRSRICMWNWDGREVARRELERQEFPTEFDPSGTRVLLCGERVRLWDPETGSMASEWNASRGTQSPDGRRILLWGNVEPQVRDVATGSLVQILHQEGGAGAACWTPDGRRVVTGSSGSSGTIRVWDHGTPTDRQRLSPDDLDLSAEDVRFSAQGDVLLAYSRSDETVIIWDLGSASEMARIGPVDDSPLALDPVGDRWVVNREDDLCILDRHTGREVDRLDGVVTDAIAFLPDGHDVLVSSALNFTTDLQEELAIWDTSSGTRVTQLLEADYQICSVACAPNGDIIAAGDRSGRLRAWSPKTRELLWSAEVHEAELVSLDFSRDSRMLISSSEDGTASAMAAITGRELARFDHGQPLNAATFAHDGTRVVTAGSDVRIWSLATGRELLRIDSLNDKVVALAFFDDSRLVAVSSVGEIETYDPVPTRVRIPEWNALEYARLAGRRVGDRILSETADPGLAVARIQSDSGLTSDVRRAALVRITERTEEVRRWIRGLEAVCPLRNDVEKAILSREGEDAWTRDFALATVHECRESAWKLLEFSRTVLQGRPQTVDLDRAVRCVIRAAELAPGGNSIDTVREITEYLVGRPPEALQALRSARGTAASEAERLAYLAMTLYMSGNDGETERTIDNLRALAAPIEELGPLLERVERLLSSRDDHLSK